VPVHPPTSGVAQDRSGDASVDGPVDRATDRRRQRDWNDPGALADNPQHPVAVFFAEVGGIGAGRFKDPQPQQTEHRDEGEVVVVGRFAASGEQRFELQVGESQGR